MRNRPCGGKGFDGNDSVLRERMPEIRQSRRWPQTSTKNHSQHVHISNTPQRHKKGGNYRDFILDDAVYNARPRALFLREKCVVWAFFVGTFGYLLSENMGMHGRNV